MLDAGNGKQVNANAGGDVVGWEDMTDENAWWAFEEVDRSALASADQTLWEAKPEQMQIMTLPMDISYTFDGDIYVIIGMTEDNQLALAIRDTDVPAGRPTGREAVRKKEKRCAVKG